LDSLKEILIATTTDFRHSPPIKKTKTKGTLAPIFSTRKTVGTLPPTASEFLANTISLIGNQWFIGTFGSFLNNEIADLDYRFDTGVTLGYYFLKNDKTKLSLETGPGYTWENQDKLSDNYFSIRLAQTFEHKFNKELKIWQSTILTPKASDLDDTLFIAEAGIQILLTEDWSLRSALRYQYDNTPAVSQDKSDILLLTGLSYSLGGFKKSTKPDRMTLKPKDKKTGEIKMGWTTTAALNHSLAKGNSDSLFLGASIDSAYRKKDDETFLSLTYSFSENGGDTSADSLRTSIQHNRVFNETYFLGGGLGYFRDDIADVSYRFTPSATAGYYFLKQNDITLSVEAGPSMTSEKIGGLTEDFFSITAAQNFTWQISENLNFSQHITGIFDPSDRQNYIFSARAKLDTNITPNLAWRIAWTLTKDNTPAATRKSTDSTLTTGIALKF
jgi:putative salt-induced outer membrane protein